MIKKKLFLLTVLIGITSAGCVDLSPTKPNTQGGSSLLGDTKTDFTEKRLDDYEIDIVSNEKSTSSRSEALRSITNLKFTEAKKIEIELSNITQWNGKRFESEQVSKEVYDQGTLKSYLSEIKTNNVNYRSFYDGEKYFVNHLNNQWEEAEGVSKVSTLYLYLMKILLEGSDTLEITDGLDQIRVTRKIEDESLKNGIYQLVDIPIIFTPNAILTVEFEYQIDEKTGLVNVVNGDIQVEDLGQTFDLKLHAKINMDAEFADLSMDTNEVSKAVETEDVAFSDYFIKANPVDDYNYYEEYINEIVGEDSIVNVKMGNYLAGVPYAAISGQLVDSNLVSASFNYQNKRIFVENGKVKEEASKDSNNYQYLVNKAVDIYDELELLEASEDDTTYTLRKIIENDFESFKSLSGPIDIAKIERDSAAVYGLDFVINRQTQVLETVYFWSSTVDDEAINHLVRVSFRNMNGINPNYIKQNIDKVIWDYLK